MIPYDIDPSLHAAAPEPLLLDDGFSARRGPAEPLPASGDARAAPSLEDALASKSEF